MARPKVDANVDVGVDADVEQRLGHALGGQGLGQAQGLVLARLIYLTPLFGMCASGVARLSQGPAGFCCCLLCFLCTAAQTCP